MRKAYCVSTPDFVITSAKAIKENRVIFVHPTTADMRTQDAIGLEAEERRYIDGVDLTYIDDSHRRVTMSYVGQYVITWEEPE